MADRLHEQTINNSPNDSKRIAFGAAGSATENITFGSLYTLLLTKLGFLKTSSNLSDLGNPVTARTNLGVYSTTQVDSALSGRQATLVDVPYTASTRVHTGIEEASFYCNVAQFGKIVTGTGNIKINSSVDDDEILFTLPTSIGVPSTEINFIAIDASGSGACEMEIYIEAGTRNVRCKQRTGIDFVESFGFSYYV